ncbi:MAG: sugar phosphate isomerase/epimerase family protein, partial [Gammaproteobacteria bacterium]
MHIVRFTKFWAGMSAQAMGERAAALGYDGLDLAVRPGHAVAVDNVSVALPDAVRGWRALGVECSMITAEVSLTDASAGGARTLFRAAAESGVPRIKIGYFQYAPGSSFDTAWEAARRALEGFEELARETGVQAMVHSHGGLCLGSTCAGLRHLLEGFDPAFIGAYPDLGHLAIGGEDPRIGLAMLRGSLAAVAAKDARHVRDTRPDA